jgi:large repetitive protein
VGIFNITPLPQTITFDALSDQSVGALLTLTASSSSGLVVTYSSETPSVCTVSGSNVSLLSPGNCTIRVSQAGNGSYAAAANVTRSFSVSAVPQ